MAESTMQLEDWLDDLCVRFIINLPEEDLSSVARICFQVEEAQWFYEDFIRPLDPALPSMSLRTFCLRIFQHCPLLANFSVENHTKAFEEFLEYKTRVPVRGAIMLNHEMDSAVLVKGWKKGANWGFPGGKINKDEDDLDCAIREVYEETGLDLRRAGLVSPEGRHKYIELPIKSHEVRLYVFRDVPMDTNFEPQTRKEISKIQWYPLSELPTFRKKGGQHNTVPVVGANKFYMVAPFMVPLRKWVIAQKKIDDKRAASGQYLRPTLTIEETVTEDETAASYEPVVPPREPAINTLDGATRELHRLLKMQPPTQGVQPPPLTNQDKGSALLSILQSKATGPAMAPQPNIYNPHTPQDFGTGAVPQPRNPHHHNNQRPVPFATQLQPPSFPLPPNQGAGSWNPAQHQPHGGQPFAQGYQGNIQPQFGNNNAPLVHPQPLPPQVQRSIFNKSTFQEGSSPQLNAPSQIQNQHYAPKHGHAQPPQMPHQPQPIPNPKPVLNGRSMELLGAFKRSTEPAAPNGNAPPAQPSGPGSGQPSFYGQNAAPSNLPALSSVVTKPKPTQNVPAGAGAGPPGDQRRAALLGMFKKASPDAASSQQQGASHASVSTPAGNDLLNQLMAGNKKQPMPTAQPAPTNPAPGPGLSLENLFLQSRPAESGMHTGVGHALPGQAPTSTLSPGNSAQPVRILQRGQAIQQPSPGSRQPSIATKSPSYGNQPQPGPADTASPAGTSPALQNRRPGGGNDQKRQLLSLFGKQQGAPSPGALSSHRGSTGSADAPRSRLSSLASGNEERRGSQTPISPADQSFLLGYLQSVTNNASR